MRTALEPFLGRFRASWARQSRTRRAGRNPAGFALPRVEQDRIGAAVAGDRRAMPAVVTAATGFQGLRPRPGARFLSRR